MFVPQESVQQHAGADRRAIATRETPDWVWATFWWHDVPGTALYGNDRPTTVRHPLDQFLMEVAQSADFPVAPEGTQHITFNPYLEAGFALGTESNCIGCHQRAQWTTTGPGEVYPVHRGSMSPNDPFFAAICERICCGRSSSGPVPLRALLEDYCRSACCDDGVACEHADLDRSRSDGHAAWPSGAECAGAQKNAQKPSARAATVANAAVTSIPIEAPAKAGL